MPIFHPLLPDTPGQLFRHVDGGFYRFVALGRHTDDRSLVVVYEHVWPFEAGLHYVRPAKEWIPERFAPATEQSLQEAMRVEQGQAQAEVTVAKAARRAAQK